jgi:hypothetical protein
MSSIENVGGAAPTEYPLAYDNEHGVQCLAQYVRVFDVKRQAGSAPSVYEVGAIVKGERFDMAGVERLDPDKLAEEGVEVPSDIASRMHARREERRLNDWRHSEMPLRVPTTGFGPVAAAEFSHAA